MRPFHSVFLLRHLQKLKTKYKKKTKKCDNLGVPPKSAKFNVFSQW